MITKQMAKAREDNERKEEEEGKGRWAGVGKEGAVGQLEGHMAGSQAMQAWISAWRGCKPPTRRSVSIATDAIEVQSLRW